MKTNFFILILFFSSCSITKPETDRTRNHQVKYKAELVGSRLIVYRSADGKPFVMIKDTASTLNTTKPVPSPTRTTTEKY